MLIEPKVLGWPSIFRKSSGGGRGWKERPRALCQIHFLRAHHSLIKIATRWWEMAGAVLVTLSPESPEQGRRRATPNKTQMQNGSGGVMRHPEVLLFTCQVIKACGEWDKSLANSLWLAQSFNLRTASSFSNKWASSRASPSILFYFALVDERKKNFNFISRARVDLQAGSGAFSASRRKCGWQIAGGAVCIDKME